MESSKGIIVHAQVVDNGSGVEQPKDWGTVQIIIPQNVKNDIGQDVSGELMSDLKTLFEKYDRQAADFIYQTFKQRKAEWKPRGSSQE